MACSKERREKINKEGEYLPFYGYTSVCMCKNNPQLENIEVMIRESALSQYYSPLPASSYHMTLFNIWHYEMKKLLPVIKRWVEAGNELPDNDQFLTIKELHKDLIKARKACRETIQTGFNVSWEFKPRLVSVLNLKVYPDNKTMDKIKLYRDKCKVLFGREQENLDEIGLHISLAYKYKDIPGVEVGMLAEALKKLHEEIKDKIEDKIELNEGDVYGFTSMERFPTLEEIGVTEQN